MQADSKRQAQRCHHQPESLTAVLFQLDCFSTEVAESEFRTQPVATAVSATGSVDTTPTCTPADAHFSRARIAVHSSQHFSHVGPPHWLRVKGICVAHFSALMSISFVMSLSDGPLGRYPPVTSSPACSLSRPSASSTSLGRRRVNPCASAHWSGTSGCLANPTPNTARVLRLEEATP